MCIVCKVCIVCIRYVFGLYLSYTSLVVIQELADEVSVDAPSSQLRNVSTIVSTVVSTQ